MPKKPVLIKGINGYLTISSLFVQNNKGLEMANSNNKAIFISYCHADNQNLLGEGWIEQFHELLRLRLKQITGARTEEDELGIWRDKELQDNEEFAAVLFEEINKVSIVVSVMSPSYVSSEWCQREIKQFIESAGRQGGLLVDNQARILKVLKTPVDREKHPEPLRGQMGYQFYIIDKDTKIPQEFTLLKGDTNNTLALQKINDIAYNIINTLKSFNKVKAANDGKQQKANGISIYLAETSYDLDEQQKAVRRELEAWGYRVLPEGELPLRNPNQFRETVEDALQQCELSIHLIGENRAVGVAGETEDTVNLQNQLAAEWSNQHSLKRLIWLPLNLHSTDQGQQHFIDLIQTDSQAQNNAEVLQVAHHELISVIHETLKKLSQTDQNQQTDSKHQKIYVSYAIEDKETVKPLINYLFDNGYDVLEPLADNKASDQQILEIYKRNLGDCDGILIFANAGGEFWLKMQLSEVQRASALRGSNPMLAEAIYLFHEADSAKQRIRTHYQIIEGLNPFNPESLATFLSKLGEVNNGK